LPRHGVELVRFYQQPGFDPLDGGSIFPTLEKLIAKNLVELADVGGGQMAYVLTSGGRETFESEPNAGFESLFGALLAGGAAASKLAENSIRLRMALLHVARHGNDEQRLQASAIALQACSDVYGLLAD
jgi:DNA-binding PadR family transcriptional regulator